MTKKNTDKIKPLVALKEKYGFTVHKSRVEGEIVYTYIYKKPWDRVRFMIIGLEGEVHGYDVYNLNNHDFDFGYNPISVYLIIDEIVFDKEQIQFFTGDPFVSGFDLRWMVDRFDKMERNAFIYLNEDDKYKYKNTLIDMYSSMALDKPKIMPSKQRLKYHFELAQKIKTAQQLVSL